MDEIIWIQDPKLLYTKYKDIYPKKDNNNFNAIARYFILTGLIFLLFKRYKWVYICFIGFIIISFIGYLNYKDQDKNNKINLINQYNSCRRSTINNPMSNLLNLDKYPELEACIDEPKERIDENLYYNFFEDQNDLNAKKRLRSFITMPITSHPNNRLKFLDFAYGNMVALCKYDGIGCEKFRDLRYKK